MVFEGIEYWCNYILKKWCSNLKKVISEWIILLKLFIILIEFKICVYVYV